MSAPPQVVDADEFDGLAAVHLPNQGTRDERRCLRIDEATYTEDEFVLVAYDGGMEVIGTSDPIPAGESFSGAIWLDRPLTETQTVTVTVHHVEDGEPGEWVQINGIVVLDNATVGPQEFLGVGRVR